MKNKILKILKSSDEYISGEKISEELNISRAAVWKHIKKLRDEGHVISSVTNKGYMLSSSPDVLSAEEILNGLKTQYIAQNVFFKETVTSTNEWAKEMNNAPDGSLFISEIQKGGKGRLGRAWKSPKGVGIWMTYLLKPDIPPSEVSSITLIAGLAVCRALENETMIKWPNDVVSGGKKVCGILTEMSAEAESERINYIVCGIGINVNNESFPEEIGDRATSMYLLTGEKQNRAELVRKTAYEFERLYDIFVKNGFDAIREEYKEYCVTLGRGVQAVGRDKVIKGTACDITSDGALVIDTGEEKVTVSSGEVSVRGIYGYI